MTIDEFRAIVKKNKKTAEQLRADIDKLMQRESQLDAEAKAAVESGDSDLYIKKMEDKDKVSQAIFVKRSFLDRQRNYYATREDAVNAWADYAAKYEKTMSKLRAEYTSHKEKLFKLYADMVELQGSACAVRENVAEAAGLDSAKDDLPLNCIPLVFGTSFAEAILIMNECRGFCDPDAVFYACQYKGKSGPKVKEEAARLYTILVDQKPADTNFKWPEIE